MKKPRTMLLVVISVPLVSAGLTGGTRYAWDKWSGTPSLECPRSLNIGEKKRGDIAIGYFKITNAGKDVLHLDQFQTSCSCAGVEQEIEGKRFRIKALSLAPGQETQLLVRMGVGVRPGQSQRVQVAFASNDPKHPQWRMEVFVPRVTGGFFPDPTAVVFGTLSPGEKYNRIIDLYDNGTADRKIEKIYNPHPERFTATILNLPETDKQRVHPTAGKLFARIQIAPHTERPGRFDDELQVSLSNEDCIERIPVLGEVVGAAECRPATLVLPRRVGNDFVRSGPILVYSRQEKPIEIAVDFAPPDIIADLRAIPDHPDRRLLHIEWRPSEKTNKQPLSERPVRIRVRCNGQDSKLEAPIILAENQS